MHPKPLHIIVLAAGKGSRMHSERAKVLHEVGGKPLLGHVLDTAKQVKPAQIHVVIGHGKEQIRASFAGDTTLNWVEQERQLGTGHAVAQALPNIEGEANILMLTADVPLLEASTLKAMLTTMTSSPLTLLTAVVDDATGLGRIQRDESNAVVGIVEHKDANSKQRSIKEINSGIIGADAELLRECLEKVSNDNTQGEYYLTDIVEIAAQNGCPVAAVQPQSSAEVMGINSRAQLALAEREHQQIRAQKLMAAGVTIIDPRRIDIRGEVSVAADTVIDINVVIQGPSSIGRNCYIGPNSFIRSSTLEDNVSVHPNCVIEQAKLCSGVNVGPFARLRPGTDLAENVRIGNFVETKNATIAAESKVNHLSYVGDASIGRETNIGAGVITCNYDGANKHQTTIGDNVFVGSDCQLVAPVEIEDGATIGAGSTITSKVGADQLAISRAKQRLINNWQRPVKDQKKK